MAITVSNIKRRKWMNSYAIIADVTFDDSYPSGGESLKPADLGLQVIEFVSASPAGGYIFEYDYSAEKLLAFTPTAAHTHAENDDGGATDPNDPAPADEVGDTEDLSTVTARIMAVGY